ncbi:helix-turn-helix transcriptional regulator [Actinoallomurus purpureus]|uniref:helix-turn-helix domain-containing protein n=1 Tax=Actinoallomurus purpureus TaxID=478114 RepID=UPI002093449D|nr:helix-turn-helix transcriptional regulator [Actinoallomurus purpureus]MCO6009816.1 helix-turn-helix transcriptional regulator [Actinoallomurus purpureus]
MSLQGDRDRDPLLETFADELRFRRETADLSRNKLAEALGCTPQWIGKVEACEKPPSEAFAQDLDTCFATEGLFHRQWKKIKKYRRSKVLLPGFPQFAELEAQAEIIRAFSAQVIPGLLQTEDYMRALMSTSQGPRALDERVAGRIERQTAVFDRETPAQAWFVIDEAALHRNIGGRDAMRTQLAKLTHLASSPNVHVRVLPFESVTYAGLDGMFISLTLPDGTEIAYHEGPGVNQLTQELTTINEYRVRFDLVMGESYPRSESLKMISKTLENLG